MNKQAKIYAGILGSFLVVFAIWHFTADVYHVSAPYRNEEHGFSLNYPQGWEIVDTSGVIADLGDRLDVGDKEVTPPAVLILAPDRGETLRPNVIVSVFPSDPGQELGQPMLDDFLADIDKAGTNFGMISQSLERLAGREAMHASYKLRVDWQARPYYVQYDSYLIPRGEQLYAITCTSTLLDFARHEPVFRKIFNSFEFVES